MPNVFFSLGIHVISSQSTPFHSIPWWNGTEISHRELRGVNWGAGTVFLDKIWSWNLCLTILFGVFFLCHVYSVYICIMEFSNHF